MKNYICDVCQQEVDDSNLYRINNGQLSLTGHKECIVKQLAKQGLNESVNQIKKTNFILG